MELECKQPGPCFGRGKEFNTCRILNEPINPPQVCRFQKERKDYTNGIYYPYVKPEGGATK